MDVGAVERLLRSLAAFAGLGGLEFRVSSGICGVFSMFFLSNYRFQLNESRCSESGSATI